MPANKPIRRSQLISPWGIGQMINFPKDESLMVAGLDLWEHKFRTLEDNLNQFIIDEERLSQRLGVKNFRLPPDFRDPGNGVIAPSLFIPFIRFPRWHYCPNCGFMHKLSIFSHVKPRCPGPAYQSGPKCTKIAAGNRRYLIPVRFITACTKGHIEDFPFLEWVHKRTHVEGEHQLRFRAGKGSGALTGIEISCTCGEKRSMAGAFNDNALNAIGVSCSGSRPWLGEETENNKVQHCGEYLTVVQKGASNVYFAHVYSSIFLPKWQANTNRQVIDILEKNWNYLNAYVNGELDRARFNNIAEIFFQNSPDRAKTLSEQLYQAALTKIQPSVTLQEEVSEELYRKMEYDAVLKESGGDNDDFKVKKVESHLFKNHVSNRPLWSYFSNICLVHKLKETRAFVGFSRLVPDDGKTLYERKNFIKLGNLSWLPAITVKGEGVFFEFNKQTLEEWSKKSTVIKRFDKLNYNYKNYRNNLLQPYRKITPQFILIHTFAHLIINQFSFECGYGSSALRERIYCNLDNPSHMAGVLIYTASGDSEGSLGGLVRQGKPGNLENIVSTAIENARWCSSDPICIDTSGQGPGSCNLSACHNCALLPETCCEEYNILLDRAFIIGTLDEPNIGYFN